MHRPHRPTDRRTTDLPSDLRREPTAQIEATIDALLLLQAHLGADDGVEAWPEGASFGRIDVR